MDKISLPKSAVLYDLFNYKLTLTRRNKDKQVFFHSRKICEMARTFSFPGLFWQYFWSRHKNWIKSVRPKVLFYMLYWITNWQACKLTLTRRNKDKQVFPPRKFVKWQGTFSFPGLFPQDFCSCHHKNCIKLVCSKVLFYMLYWITNWHWQEGTRTNNFYPSRKFVKWQGTFSFLLGFDKIFATVKKFV